MGGGGGGEIPLPLPPPPGRSESLRPGGGGQLEGWALKIETFLGTEKTTSETRVHKITNVDVPVFKWHLDLIILMPANTLFWLLEGVGPENLQLAFSFHLFAISGPKKVLIFRTYPFLWPL